MKITRIETFQADAGWRMFSFLKITTDTGIIGWSEFNESFGSVGLSDVIRGLSPVLIGRDPRMYEQVTQHLHVLTRQSRGGLKQQAIAAIENALLDVTGKAYGIPVYALFGGPIRDRIPVYWSHFGTYRVRGAALMGVPPLSSYDDLARHAREVKDRGFRALKTNIIPVNDGVLSGYVPGFGRTPGWPELNWNNKLTRGVTEQLMLIRDAVGPDMGIHLDINFNFKTEGFKTSMKSTSHRITSMATFAAPSCRTSASWRSTSTVLPGGTSSIQLSQQSKTVNSYRRKAQGGASV